MLNPNDVLSHISFLLVFLEGLLSFLSPCVLPLLPVYWGIWQGRIKSSRIRSAGFSC